MNAVPYLILCVFLLYLYLNENRTLAVLPIAAARMIAFVVLLIFIGLRGHIYSDFINYYLFFENLPDVFHLSSSTFEDWYFEPGFVLYSSAVKTLLPNYFCWVFVNTLVDLAVFSYVFKRYTCSRILPFVFFLAFNGLLIEFNLYRNVKAMDLFLLSIPYLEKRKILPYMLLNLLGMTFHTSSVIYLPLYFVLTREISKIVKWGGIIVANVIFLCKISIVNDFLNSLDIFQALAFYDRLAGHVEASEVSQTFSFGYVERTFSVLVFTSCYETLVAQRSSNRIFYNCFWMYYMTFLCFYEVQVLVDRIPALFMFSYWILYPNLLALNVWARKLIYAAVMFIVFVKVVIANNIPPARYENVLFGADDYHSRKEVYESFVDW